MPLDRERLAGALDDLARQFSPPRRYVIACSGGLDSAVLLHLLASLDDGVPRVALHIDHGLQAESAGWAETVKASSRQLGIDCTVMAVDVVETGGGLEAAARTARYAAFEAFVRAGDWLLTAQHRDDQAETLLLNLLRGSGALGLAAMPPARALGAGTLVRPLLDCGQAEIRAYAIERAIDWTEDPTNSDCRFDRNFLRHNVMPVLASRWPGAAAGLARSAELALDTQALLDALAAADLKHLGAANTERVPIPGLKQLDRRRQANLLRYACRQQHLPLPPAPRLHEVLINVLHSADDAQPQVAWPGASVRRFRDTLFLLPEATEPPGVVPGRLTPDAAVDLGSGLGRLTLVAVPGTGIRPDVAEAGLDVRGRLGGERLRPSPATPTRRLKTLFQEAHVLPWMRDRIPLLEADGHLVAVGDLWVDAQFQGEPGYAVDWAGKPALM
ncbi:MAG: tRNA lysidine(34) synthetase TilS [Pseudomonadota bacterium]